MGKERIGKLVLEIPDCEFGGDHNSILFRSAKRVVDDDSILSSSTLCPKCKLDVTVSRNSNNGEISASLEETPPSNWMGM